MLKNQCRSETFSRHLGKNIAVFFFQFALLTRINFQADMTFHAISSFVRSWEGWLIIQLNWKSLHSSTRNYKCSFFTTAECACKFSTYN